MTTDHAETDEFHLSTSARWSWSVGYGSIVAGFIVGYFSLGRYLYREHARISLFESVGLWWGDGTAFASTTFFVVRYALCGARLPQNRRDVQSLGLWWWLTMLSIVGGLLVDLGMSLRLEWNEYMAFQQARRTQGTVVRIQHHRSVNPNACTLYYLKVDFLDQNNAPHTGEFNVRFPDDAIALIAEAPAIQRQRVGWRINISHSPERPERYWLTSVGWSCGDRLAYMSGLTLVCQMFASALFLQTLWARRCRGELPWWHIVHGPLLLLIEAGLYLIIGCSIASLGHGMFHEET